MTNVRDSHLGIKISRKEFDQKILLADAESPGAHIWWTADLHLNHVNIIEASYCPERLKTFGNLENMNQELILRWNSRVRSGDTVILVGDAVMGRVSEAEDLIRQLNGSIILIEGNHDRSPKARRMMLESRLLEIHRRIEFEVDGIGKILVQHHPAKELCSDYALFICGHIHQHWRVSEKMINVGVDVWNYQPVTLSEILKTYEQEKNSCL